MKEPLKPASAWMVMVDPEAVALPPAEVVGSPMMVRGPWSASGLVAYSETSTVLDSPALRVIWPGLVCTSGLEDAMTLTGTLALAEAPCWSVTSMVSCPAWPLGVSASADTDRVEPEAEALTPSTCLSVIV